MCKVNSCCGCCDLRTGCIVLSVIGVLSSFSSLGFQGLYIHGYPVSTVGLVFGLILGIAVWALLLLGAVLNNETMVLINLILVGIKNIAMVIAFIIVVAQFGALGSEYGGLAYLDGYQQIQFATTTFIVIIVTALLISIALEIYFMIVIYSFYQELKYGS